MLSNDRELLRQYADEACEEAFAEIVRRHVNLVYGTALRQLCGNATLAQDVTQAVFTTLAGKGPAVRSIQHLSAWLYTTTRFTVSHTVRAERRRQNREQKAQTMHAIFAGSGTDEVLQVPPSVLDTVLERLEEGDREAILLRFFEGESFAAIGSALHVSEDAARMRVARALEKIRAHFSKHGITSTAAAVSAALASQAVAAPAGLAASASAAALGSVAATTTAGATLGAITFMSSKTTAWIASAAALAALGYSSFQYRDKIVREDQLARLSAEHARQQETLQQSEQRVEQLNRRVAQAEQHSADLQRRIDGVVAAKAAPMIRSNGVAVDDGRKRMIEKMAQMKPQLEAGMPIKGAVVVLVNGKPEQRQVAFVIGKETQIEGVDDGTYTVMPTLRPDGSVNYALTLVKKTVAGNVEKEQKDQLPEIVQTPWEGFTIQLGRGRVFAFDADETGP